MTILQEYRGFNAWPTATNLAHVARVYPASPVIFRWGPELQDYWSSPTAPVNVAAMLADLRPVIDAGHRAIIVFLGATSWMNANVDGSDGGHHRYVHAASTTERNYRISAMTQICAYVMTHFTASERLRIRFEDNNEMNLEDFNKDLQPPADTAASAADFLATVKAHSDIKTVFGSLAPYGDLGNTDPAEVPQHIGVWGDAMVAAQPSILGYDFFGGHTYHYDGGNQGDSTPSDNKGWNGTVQVLDWRTRLIGHGVLSPKMMITEYGAPSSGSSEYEETWQAQHLLAHEAVMIWYAAAGLYDRWATMHTLRDNQDYGATTNIHDYFGTLHKNGTNKAVTNQLIQFWSTPLDVTTPPPEDPNEIPVIDGTPIEVAPTSWGYRLGFTIPFPAIAGSARACRSLGCKNLRVVFDEGGDANSIATLAQECATAGVHLTVALRPAGGDYFNWTTSRLLFYCGSVKALAGYGVKAIELGPDINDPNRANGVTLDSGGEFWMLAALIFAHNAIASDFPKVELYAGSLATVGTGTPPHTAIDALARGYNKELSQVLTGFSINGDDSASGALTDASALPYANPIWHLRDALTSMQAEGLLRPVSITKVGFTGTSVQLAYTFLTYIGAIEDLVRTRGLRVGRVFWNTLFDADSATFTAPFTSAGVARGNLVNAIVARAALTFPG